MRTENKKNDKQVLLRHKPKGLTIIHEDEDIIVIDKACGFLTMATETEKDKTAYFELNNYVRKGNRQSRDRVFIVHRLDRETSGVVVFAKTEKVKEFLQEKWEKFSKQYFAVVHGKMGERDGVIETYLAENNIHRMYSVSNPRMGKLAKTGYRVFKESKNFSMLKIDLFTGRKNQIRVHFAERGNPVLGDKMYGKKGDKTSHRLALHAGAITIIHPRTKKEVTYMAPIPPLFKALLKFDNK